MMSLTTASVSMVEILLTDVIKVLLVELVELEPDIDGPQLVVKLARLWDTVTASWDGRQPFTNWGGTTVKAHKG